MPALKEKPETFSFQVKVVGIDIENTPYADLLFDAGCGDALVFVQNGSLFLDFDREAVSFDSAINSAIACIMKAGGSIESVNRHTSAD
jgi:hypothetical protein